MKINKDSFIGFKLSKQEHQELKDLAKKVKLNVSAYCRLMTLGR